MKKLQDMPAALDHALYEIQMIAHAALALRDSVKGPQENAWLESFAVHARNLNEFFGNRGSMKPEHFGPWRGVYNFSQAISTRASVQVAHLTYGRERPEEKTAWPLEEIFTALRQPVLEFLNMVRRDEALMAYNDNRARTANLLAAFPGVDLSPKNGIPAGAYANIAGLPAMPVSAVTNGAIPLGAVTIRI